MVCASRFAIGSEPSTSCGYIVSRIFSDNLEESAKNSNTWFLQATCTVTNEYGAELDGYCEAKVTGNKDNPKVKDFKVYKLH